MIPPEPMELEVFVHNIDPVIFALPNFGISRLENLAVRWYGLAYLAGFVISYLLIRYLAARGRSPLRVHQVEDFVFIVAVGTMLGGRLGYSLFYSPSLLWEWGGSFPYWGFLRVWEGGMASHGGIIGISLACLFYAWWRKVPFLHNLDLVVVGGSLGVFFGRIANFINGELYGRAAPEGFRWAVKFPQEMYTWLSDRASLLKLEALAPAAEQMGRIQLRSGQWVEVTQESWVTWVRGLYRDGSGTVHVLRGGIDQMIAAIQAGNEQITHLVAPHLVARYPSQLIQALLEGLLVFVVLALLWIRPRKPGVIAASFGVLYSIARIVGEQFRLPDAHIGFQALGLTRGQWLSVVMLLIAVGLLWWTIRREAKPLGGWKA